jgi:Glycosyl transferase family 2
MPIARALIRPRELLARIRRAWASLRATQTRVDELARAVGPLVVRVDEVADAVGACRAELVAVQAALSERAASTAAEHDRTMQALRIVRDGDAAAREALWQIRGSAAYERAFEEDEPLVTVIISTYRNWPLLRDRALPSVLAQTYKRWEAIVVGDAAPDDARRVVLSFGDERLRYVNLPYRGPYPADPHEAWLVSGTTAWNTGLALARGSWIASNGDDDALRPECIASLLAHARSQRAEVAYGYIHQMEPDLPDGRQLGAFPPAFGRWNLQASLLHGGLRFMSMQPSDWIFNIPNDWSLADRMLRIGVRFSMVEKSVVDHYPSTLWNGREPRWTPTPPPSERSDRV